MLSARYKLTSEQFSSFQPTQTVHSEFFTLKKGGVFTETPLSSPLFAVVVSKKVAKLAVKRNVIKRKVFSLVQKHQNSLPEKPYAYIFYIKKGILEADTQTIEADFKTILSKVHP